MFNVVGDCLEQLSRHHGTFWGKYTFVFLSNILERVYPLEEYTIVSHLKYSKFHTSSEVITLAENRMGYAANAQIVGKEEQILKKQPLPPLKIYCHKNVYIRHSSDYVFNKEEKSVINDFCANNENDNNKYVDKRQFVIVRRKERIDKELESGIKLGGKFSFNYYHSIYEHLIRLLPLSEKNDVIPKEVPIIIDEEFWNIPSLKRIYDILSRNLGRPTIILRKEEQILVHNLYCISDINYIVPEHKDYTKGLIEDYVFDKDYTLKLRNTLLLYRSKCELPKRFFITRRNTNHRHFNEDELFAIIEPFGFQKIAPEDFSFEQQMSLFYDAEYIIGGSGAAFTNLLFTSPGCMTVCVYRNSPYIPAVFTVPACFNDAKLLYFQTSKGVSVMKAHTDFSIDAEEFKQYVNTLFQPLLA